MSEYNTRNDYLKQSIFSILNQTYKNIELIIINDGTKSNLEEIVDEFNDERITVLDNKVNKGFVYSLNKGIKNSSGKYVARMDTDDIADKDRIKKQINFIKSHDEFSVVGSKAVEFSDLKSYGILGHSGEIKLIDLMKGITLIHPSVIIKKEDLIKIGYYNEVDRAEDLALWFKFLENGYRLFSMNDVLIKYRVNLRDYKKRSIKKRIGEIKTRLYYNKKLKAPFFCYITIAKSIIAGIVPSRLVFDYRKTYILKKIRPNEINRINILHIVGGMDHGGVETLLMNIYSSINREKYKFVFLCYKNKKYDFEEDINKLGGKIIIMPSINKGIIKYIYNIIKIIRDENIDIVHAHTYYNSAFSLAAAKLANVKYRIIHSHLTSLEKTDKRVIRTIYKTITNKIIALSANIYLSCGNNAGAAMFKERKYTVINNCVDAKKFKFSQECRDRIRLRYNISQKNVLIGSVGRLVLQKNFKYLIKIFAKHHSNNNDSKLLIIGGGEEESNLKKYAQKLNVYDDIIFAGNTENVFEFYSAMDIFIMTSFNEGFPLVLIEAQSNGLPCLVTDTIDRTIKMTNNFYFLHLNKDSEWLKKINSLYNISINKRSLGYKIVKNSESDIANGTKQIEMIYNYGELL
jgi:glycosyltransferase involved in cell wall biosynthesis